ncbi:hypothetical protein DBR27_23830, partial [Flavobacterium sp. HMWF030]
MSYNVFSQNNWTRTHNNHFLHKFHFVIQWHMKAFEYFFSH